MKCIMNFILIILVFVLAGCGTGPTGQGVPLTGFDKVEIKSGFNVDISVGEDYSVVLKVADDNRDNVEAVKKGDTLIIRPKPGHNIQPGSLKAEVTMPVLTGLVLGSGSHVAVSGSGGDVTISVTGGSHANLADFAIENADLTVTNGSDVTVNVNGRLDVKVSGGSHVRYKGEPQIGEVDLSGGSTFRKK